MFESREDAGRKLGQWLRERGVDADMVLGLPRGGVVVAAEVARILERPLDVLVVRKIGHPLFREFALGALAEHGVAVLDQKVVDQQRGIGDQLADVIREEQATLKAYEALFPHPNHEGMNGKVVLLIDDGLATGATTEAAVRSAIKQGARSVIVAAPVASEHALARLRAVADRVEAMIVDPHFEAVGRYYDTFPQTTDEEVMSLLVEA